MTVGLNPIENERNNDLRFEEYYDRITRNEKLKHIHKAIFEQWNYGLHFEESTIRNYAWINYKNVEFNLCEWEFSDLAIVYIIEV